LVLTSVHSLAAQSSVPNGKEGRKRIISFNLQLRDVCWDLPTTTFNANPVTPANLEHWLLYDHIIQHDYLQMTSTPSPWNDYCGGSSYTLEYVDGPRLDLTPNPDPLLININQFYTDNNVNNPSSDEPNFDGAIGLSVDWKLLEGVHTVRIRAQEGVLGKPSYRIPYRHFYSNNFDLTLINPCRDHPIISRDLIPMRSPVGSEISAIQPYDEFTD